MSMLARLSTLAALGSSLLLQARGDLPVHCLADDAEGFWEFELGEGSAERSSCGHSRPDNAMREPLVHMQGRRTLAHKLAVELLPGGAARVDGQDGAWTVVSDEALEVKGNGHEFLAFFGFESLQADDGGEHLPLALQKRHSRCNETVMGWYRKDDRSSFGCWFGRRSDESGSSFLQRRGRLRRSSHSSAAGAATGSRSLPKALDWRNVSGYNWVDAPAKQGTCGGCYAIAATQMLSARHRIAQQDHSAPAFSAAFPLFCGEYTQGCQGGFPYLAAKWSEDVGLVPQHCAPAVEEGGHCGLQCSDTELEEAGRFRATNHRYVRGGEEAILEELNNGPLAVSFRSDSDLFKYSGGLWTPPPLEDGTNSEPGFVAVTHAALLVGYGQDESREGYWTIQNAWGHEWGEQGSFRISRDIARERGMEGYVVAGDVVRDERPEVVFQSPAASAASLLAVQASRRAEAHGHKGEVVCREPAAGPSDQDVVVRIDRAQNFRGLSFGESAGTETAVRCAGPTPEGCRTVGPGEEVPPCASVDSCDCDLHGQELPYPGMKALAEKVVLMCSSSGAPVRALMIGLGGGAISSYIQDRCPPGRLSLESIEKDSRVAALASKFFGFKATEQNTLEVNDGFSAAAERSRGTYDAVMVDCFAGQDRVPSGCRSEDFLRKVRALLKPDGLMVQNIWARSSASPEVGQEFNQTAASYAAVFGAGPTPGRVGREVVFDAPESLQYMLYGEQGEQWSSMVPSDE